MPHEDTDWPWKLPLVPARGARRGEVVAYALVDGDVYAWASQRAWRPGSHGYANSHNEALHRLVLGLRKGDGRVADHISRDTFDNRRSNLRVTNAQGNAENRPAIRKSSPYRGVSLHPAGKWHASVMHAGRAERIGSYIDEKIAALAAAHRRQMTMDHADIDPALGGHLLTVATGRLRCRCGAVASITTPDARYWKLVDGRYLCEPCNGHVRPKVGRKFKPPRVCVNCSAETTHPKRGRCDSCYAYWRRNGRDRQPPVGV